MSEDYVLRILPAVRLAALTATVDPQSLSATVEPMSDRVGAALRHLKGALDTPIATYADTEYGMAVTVGYAHSGPVPADLVTVDLPAVRAVCRVHLGPMTTVRASWQALHRWVIDNGYGCADPRREHYVRARSEDQADWVIELQQQVTDRGR